MVQLPIEQAPEEEVTSLSPAFVKKVPGAIEVVDSKEGFEVFDQPLSLESSGTAFLNLPSAQVSCT